MTACAGAMHGGLLWPLGMVLMVGFWALVAWAGYRVYRTWIGDGGWRAEEVLARRFASGEIDEDEYRSRRDALRSDRWERLSSWDR